MERICEICNNKINMPEHIVISVCDVCGEVVYLEGDIKTKEALFDNVRLLMTVFEADTDHGYWHKVCHLTNLQKQYMKGASEISKTDRMYLSTMFKYKRDPASVKRVDYYRALVGFYSYMGTEDLDKLCSMVMPSYDTIEKVEDALLSYLPESEADFEASNFVWNLKLRLKNPENFVENCKRDFSLFCDDIIKLYNAVKVFSIIAVVMGIAFVVAMLILLIANGCYFTVPLGFCISAGASGIIAGMYTEKIESCGVDFNDKTMQTIKKRELPFFITKD